MHSNNAQKFSLSLILLLQISFVIKVSARNECYSDHHCSYGTVCCERKYPEHHVCKYKCLDESCLLNSDCGPGEYCCWNYVCKESSTTCKNVEKDQGLPGWLIAVIVISILICISVLVSIFCCLCAASATRNRGQAGTIVSFTSRPQAAAVVVPASHAVLPHHASTTSHILYPPQPYAGNPPRQANPPSYGPPPPYSALQRAN